MGHFTHKSSCPASRRHLGLLAKWGHYYLVKAIQLCPLMGLPQSSPLYQPSPCHSLTLSAWEGSHRYGSINSWQGVGGNLGPNGSMVLFSCSLPYSCGSSLVNRRVTGSCPRGRLATMGLMLPCSLSMMEQGEQGLPCIPASPPNLEQGEGDRFSETSFSLQGGSLIHLCLLLRYRNKIQNCILHQGVCAHEGEW